MKKVILLGLLVVLIILIVIVIVLKITQIIKGTKILLNLLSLHILLLLLPYLLRNMVLLSVLCRSLLSLNLIRMRRGAGSEMGMGFARLFLLPFFCHHYLTIMLTLLLVLQTKIKILLLLRTNLVRLPLHKTLLHLHLIVFLSSGEEERRATRFPSPG
jgi:hypothetical protein